MAVVEIDSPEAGKRYLLPNNSICVIGRLMNGATQGQLSLVLKGDGPNWGTSTPVANLNFVEVVPYGNAPPAPPETGEYTLHFHATTGPNHTEVPGSLGQVDFLRIPEQETVADVLATQCLWYAFVTPANENDPGPNGWDDPVKNYKPKGADLNHPIYIPYNAGSVDFAAMQENEWQHGNHASTKSSPDGGTANNPNPVQLEENNYKDDVLYGSGGIQELDALVCKLSGMWMAAFGTAKPYQQFGIGSAWNGSVPEDAKRNGKLYLGMHDGKNWSNNSGKVDTVDITWTAESCTETLRRLIRQGIVQEENYRSFLPQK